MSIKQVIIAASLAATIITRHDRDDAEYRALGDQYRTAYVDLNIPRRDGKAVPNGAATLIAPRWVLTAAHCGVVIDIVRKAESTPYTIEVSGKTFTVDSVVNHAGWDNPDTRDDIALLRLSEPVTHVQPVALYRDSLEVGKTVVLLGRGEVGDGRTTPKPTDTHLRGATNIVETADQRWITFTFDAPDVERATHLEGISGSGDSGGPALIIVDGKPHVAGISSSQNPGGRPVGTYGVREFYSRVSRYTAWIDGITSTTR